MTKFNSRHEKFIQGILEGKTQTQAYIDAGYSERNARQHAHQLVTNSYISERLEKLREERRASWGDRLDDIAEQALEMLPIMIKLGTKDEAPRVAAINLALKYAGLEPAKKLQHSGKVDGEFTFRIVGIDPSTFPEQDHE
jgi:phage terminase small subunit